MDTTQAPPGGAHRNAQADADHIGNMGRYLYQIRNMLAWMLVLWLVSIAAAVAGGVYLGAHSGRQAATSNSDCLSLGGNDPSC